MEPEAHPLAAEARRLFTPLGGRFALYTRRLDAGESIEVDCDSQYPSASVIKVAVMAAVYALRDRGVLSLDETAVVRAEDLVGGSGVLQELHPGLTVTLRDLVHLMIVVSDNTATNMLIDRAGVQGIHQFLQSNGFKHTCLQRRLMDFEARARGLENLITARETGELLQRLFASALPPLTAASSAECIATLKRQQHTDRLPRWLPKGTRSATKPGTLDDTAHDAGIVFPERGPAYVLVVLSTGLADTRPADEAIAELSRVAYEHFTGAQ